LPGTNLAYVIHLSIVAIAVSSLSKNENLPREMQMQDSLDRILQLPKEVWAVKLADRITNLQPPPAYWDAEKKYNTGRKL